MQESETSPLNASHKNTSLKGYTNLMLALGQHKGVDYNVGCKIHGYCQEIGFQNIESYVKEFKISSQSAKDLMLMRLQEWKEEALQAKLVTEETLCLWQEEIQFFPENDPDFYILSADQHYVIAQKPS